MKKIIIISLLVAFCLSVAACSDQENFNKIKAQQTKEILFQSFYFDSPDDIVKTATRTEALSYTINEDGSVLMVLPIEKYNEQIEKTKNGIIITLTDFVYGSEKQEAIPNIVRTEYSDDFSDTVIYTSNKALTDSSVRIALSNLIRNLFIQQGVTEEEIDFTIRFIKEATQEEYLHFSYKESKNK